MPKIYSTNFKESVIRFYNCDEFTIQIAIKIFKISKSTLYNWIKENKNNNLQNITNKREKYKTKNGQKIKKYIISYTLKKKTKFNVNNLKKNINKKFNRSICKSRLYGILKEENITCKKISNKIIHKNPKTLKRKIKELKNEISKHNSDDIISIDESSFDTFLRKSKGWNIKGKRITSNFKDTQRKRFTLILGVTKNKVIGFKLVNGSANKISFEDFLREDIFTKNTKQNILLMDNARIHHAITVKEYIKTTQNKVIYNVPYNPETNPIEFIFSAIKNEVRKKDNSDLKKLKENIIKAINNVNKTTLKNTFLHSLNI